jgi:hypothetical protein
LFKEQLDRQYKKQPAPYKGEPVDVFAIGVTVFNMFAGFSAFKNAVDE